MGALLCGRTGMPWQCCQLNLWWDASPLTAQAAARATEPHSRCLLDGTSLQGEFFSIPSTEHCGHGSSIRGQLQQRGSLVPSLISQTEQRGGERNRCRGWTSARSFFVAQDPTMAAVALLPPVTLPRCEHVAGKVVLLSRTSGIPDSFGSELGATFYGPPYTVGKSLPSHQWGGHTIVLAWLRRNGPETNWALNN